MKFPRHIELTLEHNPNAAYHMGVEQWLKEQPEHHDTGWASPEERKAAIATNELWVLQWYPDTPVGFFLVSAATLDALLEHAARVESSEEQAQ